MTDDAPWQHYDRDKLPGGWTYPLGRDEVTAALVSADVTLGSLSFSAGPLRADNLYVVRVYWPSDAKAKYYDAPGFEAEPLMLSVQAVPSSQRLLIGKALRDTWLERAVGWAIRAPQRGNAWTASEHHWNLIYRSDTGFTVDAS
ncbi:hypothetical protein [Arthrobacter sp. NPDC056727]|uniref:hypothetical protein n=1 Tax=Arthrobacter sp. NPDC056727 TaxID=3345927 RepID=UPI00366C612A